MIRRTPRTTLLPYTTLCRSPLPKPTRLPSTAFSSLFLPCFPVVADHVSIYPSGVYTLAIYPTGVYCQLLPRVGRGPRSVEHTSELQSRQYFVCRLLLAKKTP